MFKNSFENWLQNVAKKSNGENYSVTTVNHYISGINSIKKEFNIDFWSMKTVEEVLENKYILESDLEFIKKDTIGDGMYSCALDRLVDYVYYSHNEVVAQEIDQEIEKIENNKNLSLEEKEGFIESIVNMRNPQFQHNFRKELIKEFNSKCALCNINDKRLLIASHIIRYKDCINKSDMYKSYNGLLLCANHDALFDKHLISFTKNGNIIISRTIDEKMYNLLDLNPDLKLDEKFLNKERNNCMMSHCTIFNEKN